MERYVDTNGEFLIEVRLSNAKTFHESDLLVTADDVTDCHDYDAMEVNDKFNLKSNFTFKKSMFEIGLFINEIIEIEFFINAPIEIGFTFPVYGENFSRFKPKSVYQQTMYSFNM